MSDVVDLTLARSLRDMKRSTIDANHLSMQVPQCKMVRDFLDLHNLPWQAFYMPMAFIDATTAEERKDFCERLETLHRHIEEKRCSLRVDYDVTNEDELPHERRVFFDATLRAFIESEDHYP